MGSKFKVLSHKFTSEQRPTVNNGHKFWVPRVVVVRRFDCIQEVYVKSKKFAKIQTFESFLIFSDILVPGHFLVLKFSRDNFCRKNMERLILMLIRQRQL
jgi:hypothetical protein